jgi:tRNA G26 N,N-dimethylase Trm1
MTSLTLLRMTAAVPSFCSEAAFFFAAAAAAAWGESALASSSSSVARKKFSLRQVASAYSHERALRSLIV